MRGQLDQLYCQMLSVGFVVFRQALEADDAEWMASELELLHNVPTLIAATNPRRHQYFWLHERARYIEWASGPGHEWQRSRMRTYYEPIWAEMEPLIVDICAADT